MEDNFPRCIDHFVVNDLGECQSVSLKVVFQC